MLATLVLSCTVSELRRLKGRKSTIRTHFTLIYCPRSGCRRLSNFEMNTFLPNKLVFGLFVGDVIVILVWLHRIWMFKIRPEPEPGPDPDLGTVRFSDHRWIRLMKLVASTMLSTAIKRQYSSVLPLLCHCLPAFDKNLWSGNLPLHKFCQKLENSAPAMDFVFFVRVTLTKIANTPLHRSAALVLSVINWRFCSCTGTRQIRLEILAGAELGRISEKWPDFGFAGAEIRHNPRS